MKWCSLHQSVSHSALALLPECSLPLKQASLHTSTARPLGSSRSAPPTPPSFLSFRSPLLLHQLLSQLYKLPLFSLLFPRLRSGRSEHGKRGRHAKRCGIFFFFIALGTHSRPSQGALAFSPCLPILSIPPSCFRRSMNKPGFSADCFLSSGPPTSASRSLNHAQARA